MPTYEYFCPSCNSHHDIVQKISEEPITLCPQCGAFTLERQVSSSVHIRFSGTGFYSTDYGKKTASSCCGKCKDGCGHK